MKDKVTENEKIATDGIGRNNGTGINPVDKKSISEYLQTLFNR